MNRQSYTKNKKAITTLITLVMAVLSYLFIHKEPSTDSKVSPVLVGQGSLSYSKHARCRMECRFISEAEVQDVMENGQLNPRKSNPQAQPCPVRAVEKRTADNQRVRVVYGLCAGKKKVITVIDLENEHKCSCE